MTRCWVVGLVVCCVGVALCGAGSFNPSVVTKLLLLNRDYAVLPGFVKLNNGSSLPFNLSSGFSMSFEVQVESKSSAAKILFDGAEVQAIDLNNGDNGDDFQAPNSRDNNVNTLRYLASKSVLSEVFFDVVDFTAGTFLNSFVDEDGINGGDQVGFMVTTPDESSIYITVTTVGFFDPSVINTLVIYNQNYNTLPVRVHINDAVDPTEVDLYATGTLEFGLSVHQDSGKTYLTWEDYSRIVEMVDLNDGSAADDFDAPNCDENRDNTLVYFAGRNLVGIRTDVVAVDFDSSTYTFSFVDEDGINGGNAAHFEISQQDSALWVAITFQDS
ncbi:hypothetical protein Pelo_4748 [Pelomyxa schiedti]|nr:hypothetical protein Pelo_4748 [Pelomyxa schiedti]